MSDGTHNLSTPRKECRCPICADLCNGNPGWFMPGEAELAAQHVGLTFREFFDKYLIVEYWVGNAGDVLVLAPRRVTQHGQMATYADNFSRAKCRLLTDSGCSLSVERRPFECAVCVQCDDNLDGGQNRKNHRADIQKAWDVPKLQKWLHGLSGRSWDYEE